MTTDGIRIGVLGSGTGTNCEAIITACSRGEIHGSVVIVVSDVADAPILDRARQHDIQTTYIGPSGLKTALEPELEEQLVQAFEQAGVHLVALAGYMRVIKEPLLKAFAGRILNVHPSLLPAFPGLRAWEQAVTYGAKITGCTVHFVDEHVDGGPIVMQHPVPIFAEDTPDVLQRRIQAMEHKVFPEAIKLYAENKLRIIGRRVKILE